MFEDSEEQASIALRFEESKLEYAEMSRKLIQDRLYCLAHRAEMRAFFPPHLVSTNRIGAFFHL